ncbi:MAG: zinc ABC transporter substrate-binding protein [Armatimonadetes bacterium]|nr:zinc ABC transporter substrate-binding protein [Armatimonadota bacterium]
MRSLRFAGLVAMQLSILALAGIAGAPAAAKLSVVCTTTDLADFAQQVGGDKVSVHCILKGGQDPHFTRPTPGVERIVHDADVFIQTGLDLETWAPKVLEGARNPRLFIVTATKGMNTLEKYPQGVTPAKGDVHPAGNPHVFHDPTNAKLAVSNILAAFMAVDRANADYYRERARAYLTKLSEKAEEWDKLMAPCRGREVVAYHNTWVYLSHRYGIRIPIYLEPLPGIAPSAKHLARVIETMKQRNINVIVVQTYYPRKIAESVARQTGAEVITLAGYPRELPGTDSYIEMMEYNLRALRKALLGK